LKNNKRASLLLQILKFIATVPRNQRQKEIAVLCHFNSPNYKSPTWVK
jgi:hypothetical protein